MINLNVYKSEIYKFIRSKLIYSLIFIKIIILIYFSIFLKSNTFNVHNFTLTNCYNIFLLLDYMGLCLFVANSFSTEYKSGLLKEEILRNNSRKNILVNKLMSISTQVFILYFIPIIIYRIVYLIINNNNFLYSEIIQSFKFEIFNLIPLLVFIVFISFLDLLFDSPSFTIIFTILFLSIPGIIDDKFSKFFLSYYVNIKMYFDYLGGNYLQFIIICLIYLLTSFLLALNFFSNKNY